MSDLCALDAWRRRIGGGTGCTSLPVFYTTSGSSAGSGGPSYVDQWSDVPPSLSDASGIKFTRMFDPANQLNPSGQDCCPIAMLPILVEAFNDVKLEEMGLKPLADIKSLDAGAREVRLAQLALEASSISGSGGEAVVKKVRSMLADACRDNIADTISAYTDENDAIACETEDHAVPIAAAIALIATLPVRVAILQSWKTNKLSVQTVGPTGAPLAGGLLSVDGHMRCLLGCDPATPEEEKLRVVAPPIIATRKADATIGLSEVNGRIKLM